MEFRSLQLCKKSMTGMRGGKRLHRELESAMFGLLLRHQESPYDSPPVSTEGVGTSMYFGELLFLISIQPFRRWRVWPSILLGVKPKICE